MASEKDRYETYKDYITANETTVLEELKNWLLFGKPIVEASILYEIRKCLDPWPIHYIMENPHSRKVREGALLENGYVCESLTIKDFLNEFSGNVSLCEYENGEYDTYYTTYGEELDIPIGNVMKNITKKGMESILKRNFRLYENLQDEESIMECLFSIEFCRIVDIYSSLSIIQFYQMEGIMLKDIKK